uniref:Uncharacterized protein n=1 Tax=Lepeophtheirus salmonis TaxID=72036 RepID=A0A0K2UK11_LEPSM
MFTFFITCFNPGIPYGLLVFFLRFGPNFYFLDPPPQTQGPRRRFSDPFPIIGLADSFFPNKKLSYVLLSIIFSPFFTCPGPWRYFFPLLSHSRKRERGFIK